MNTLRARRENATSAGMRCRSWLKKKELHILGIFLCQLAMTESESEGCLRFLPTVQIARKIFCAEGEALRPGIEHQRGTHLCAELVLAMS